jgi:DNA-binding protein H-NS
LLSLRAQIDNHLGERKRELQKDIARLETAGGRSGTGVRRGRGGPRKGFKVAPKFRGPGGETWAGRGARPRWLVALLRQGRKVEEFAIDKAAGRQAKSKRKVRRKR